MATCSRSRLRGASSADTARSGPQAKEAAEAAAGLAAEGSGMKWCESPVDKRVAVYERGGLRAAGARRNRPAWVVAAARR